MRITESARHLGLQCALICAFMGMGCSTDRGLVTTRTPAAGVDRVEVLNALRDEINTEYGFRNGAPRINLGPCGRFARDFREQWNARFAERVNIAFVMSNNGSNCHHVLVRLPDGAYYDGGNGVMSESALLKLYPESRVEEMKQFDWKLLDRRSYGLGRDYHECPNYSDEFTRRVIGRRLAAIASTK